MCNKFPKVIPSVPALYLIFTNSILSVEEPVKYKLELAANTNLGLFLLLEEVYLVWIWDCEKNLIINSLSGAPLLPVMTVNLIKGFWSVLLIIVEPKLLLILIFNSAAVAGA